MVQVCVDPTLNDLAAPLLNRLISRRFASRLFAHDFTLWGKAAEREAQVRMGWVDSPVQARDVIRDAVSLRERLHARGITKFVLCGMGGSSLGPEVLASAAERPLTVLDSTHPAEVERALAGDLRSVGVIVSSKSGSTIETLTQLEAFEAEFRRQGYQPHEHIIFITDPGSPLSERSAEGYEVVLADPHVGGRFSVFTAFGLVPAVLIGADTDTLIEDALRCRTHLRDDSPTNPGLMLASAIAASLPECYALLVEERTSHRWGLTAWIEQLVAESTGKQGRGVLPIDTAMDDSNSAQFAPQTQMVCVGDAQDLPGPLTVRGTLGAQMMLWEFATAALGMLLEVDPFDQPDVESAKVAAREAMTRSTSTQAEAASHPGVDLASLLSSVREVLPEDGYVAIQAFLDRESAQAAVALNLRQTLATELNVPVSLGWGPRYLHSVGQFHKGGVPKGVFVQLIDRALDAQPDGSRSQEFNNLMKAQAAGDREVLTGRGFAVYELALKEQ
ncbi:MAG: glucose-6-phosphate isomerase [Microbacteriaceae bacterium]|nr:glucose-6-phosphate isomerase [Microbacteriaceae bacterium]